MPRTPTLMPGSGEVSEDVCMCMCAHEGSCAVVWGRVVVCVCVLRDVGGHAPLCMLVVVCLPVSSSILSSICHWASVAAGQGRVWWGWCLCCLSLCMTLAFSTPVYNFPSNFPLIASPVV